MNFLNVIVFRRISNNDKALHDYKINDSEMTKEKAKFIQILETLTTIEGLIKIWLLCKTMK
jgi:hypothetical protein